MNKEKKNRHIRHLIVMRKMAVEVHKVPYMRQEANVIAGNALAYAKAHGLEWALVTGQF
jgi:hypothetical protein